MRTYKNSKCVYLSIEIDKLISNFRSNQFVLTSLFVSCFKCIRAQHEHVLVFPLFRWKVAAEAKQVLGWFTYDQYLKNIELPLLFCCCLFMKHSHVFNSIDRNDFDIQWQVYIPFKSNYYEVKPAVFKVKVSLFFLLFSF